MRKPGWSPPSLMARAVALLARREYSRLQLDRRLRRYLVDDETADPAEIGRVLDALEAQKLLSNERFATSLVKRRSVRYGDLRVSRDLREGGIVGGEADTAMRVLDGTEPERALAVWSRRFDALPTSADERGRQGRYLQARGFSMDAISRVLAGKVEPSSHEASDPDA